MCSGGQNNRQSKPWIPKTTARIRGTQIARGTNSHSSLSLFKFNQFLHELHTTAIMFHMENCNTESITLFLGKETDENKVSK